MATFYLDHEGGSDAADGTTFANRWKTLTNGATAARIAPGDTIRMMASRRVTFSSVSWTKGSENVTLGSSPTAEICDCDSAWSVSSNVTQGNATSGAYKEGTYCRGISIAGAFTTGKAAWFDLGSNQDFSGYQQISFYCTLSTSKPTGTFKIRLCSDANGDTVVNSFTVPGLSSNQCAKVTLDYGANLGASIRSISLEVAIDLNTSSTRTFYIDHIIACKNKTASDCLTLNHLVKKSGTTNWYPIKSILGTALVLETYTSAGGTGPTQQGYGFAGTTGTADMIAVMPKLLDSAIENCNESGTATARITYAGGYNRTDMTSIDNADDFTALSYYHAYGNAVLYGYGIECVSVSKVIFALSGSFGFGNNSGRDIILDNCHACLLTGLAWCFDAKMTDCSLTCPTSSVNHLPLYLHESSVRAESICSLLASGLQLPQCSCKNSSFVVVGSQTSGVFCSTGSILDISSLDISDVVTSCVQVGAGEMRIRSGTIASSGGIGFNYVSRSEGRVMADDLTITCTSDTDITTAVAVGAPFGAQVALGNFEAAGVHKIYQRNGVIDSESSVRHTASGIAWKMQPTSTNAVERNPVWIKLAKILCIANDEVTVSAWFRRSNTGVSARLCVRGDQILGVGSDVTDDMSAAADTWEQLSVTFTPTETGMVEVEAMAWGGTTYAVYVDDLSRAVTP